MIPLPSVKPFYSQEMKEKLPSPSERQAAFYGVEERFLHYAGKEFTADVEEQYRLHNYTTVTVSGHCNKITVTYEDQLKNALELINNGMLWCQPSGLIIINSPYHLFDGSTKDADRCASAFLAHLVCSLAHRVVIRQCPNAEVNYLETMPLDHSKVYDLKQRHLLIYGPITDHFNSFDYNKAIQFLFAFRHYTRILLTSSQDLGDLLDKLKMNINYVSYFFNFNSRQDKPITSITDDKPEKKTRKKAEKKPSKIIGI